MKPNASPQRDLTNKIKRATTLRERLQSEISPHSESPYLDSLVLLSHISGLNKSQILADPDFDLDPDQTKHLQQALEKISSGMPLPHVLGKWEFFKLPFTITPEVLIPRPETEGLVELALDWLKNHPGRRRCLDIGTGSGCIAITLAKHIPDLMITATDISPGALQVAHALPQGGSLGWLPGPLIQLRGPPLLVELPLANG